MRTALTILLVSLALAPRASATVIYVQAAAAPGGDGTSWPTAYQDLQDALAVAQSGDEIWVAAGVYTPAPPTGDASATFAIPSGVAVYGGFSGEETSRSQRDPSVNITTLSGDIGQDDVFPNVTLPNSWHVVTMTSPNANTRLDGFEIDGGYAFFGITVDEWGAGLLIQGGAPTIANCGFTYCIAPLGGGVYADSSNATLDNCRFTNCIASEWIGEGGAICLAGTSTVTVSDCTFTGNEAEARGGWSLGGAIYTEAGIQLTVQRCSFSGNQALHRSGGGVDWCRGGAIFCQGNTLITHCTFDTNTSNVAGGVQSWASSPNYTHIWNSTFNNNDAIGLFVSGQPRDGAAGGIAGGGELELIGCVVHGGWSDNYGGAWVGTGANVSGCIFWNNSDGAGNIGQSNIRAADDVRYSCIQNMLVGQPGEDPPDPAKFPGSISADPLFVNPFGGDFHLQAGSPCIDAANNFDWPPTVTTDLDGNPRYFDDPATVDTGFGVAPIVDIGAYEFGSGTPNLPGDVDGDGDVDISDLGALLAAFGTCSGDPGFNPAADFDGNGCVDVSDLGVLLASFGA